ncbi:MAG TPA: hypothetical protein VHB27_24685 [Rhodopila sp.]|uniref:hypothetical protein n=1 Tax=Rhodopila sp. TaxID=2480087 RepID=UPI002B7E7CB5|nr:hypothetical protein [Rhodopila sp.]HVY18440.1 hypothetical protein [Rhodopila sp.]
MAPIVAPIDDIKGETPAGGTSGTPPADEGRAVGPESETRGGGEAPDRTLPDRTLPDRTLDETIVPPDGMPGCRAALPAGSLPGPYLEAQGDEDRAPPPNAPSPVTPAVTVASPRGDR